MRNKLATTIALMALAAALGGGYAVAADPLLQLGGGQVGVGPVQVQLPACADGVDNDGDGLSDLADPDCVSSAATSEGSGPAPPPPPPPPPSGGGTDGGGTGGGGTGGGGTDGGQAGGDLQTGTAIDNAQGGIGTGGVVVGGSNDPTRPIELPPDRARDGTPTISNPTLTIAPFGPAPIGVPNFVISQFEIPPFLLPIYQACGTQYSIPWQVLASINKIETAFGTNLNVSSAGAVGWMQFLPSTWKAYGVDANADNLKDPYNPVDAICGAARYLRAAGGQEDLRSAIFAYNHCDCYVDAVLLYANAYAKLPAELLGSLTGLTEGAHFPVAANARYADDISEREAIARAKPSRRAGLSNAADIIASSPTRRGINIYSRKGAPVVAVNDGVIKRLGNSDRLGRYIVLEDAYGNRFTYAELGRIAKLHPVPKPRTLTAEDFELITPPADEAPTAPATDSAAASRSDSAPSGATTTRRRAGRPVNTEDLRQRLYALPQRPHNTERASLQGQLDGLVGRHLPGYTLFKSYFSSVFAFDRRTTELRPLRAGSKVVAGTVLGRIGPVARGVASHVNFSIRPAGRGAPKIDPKPILDGWKLLEATAIYRAAGKNPFATNLGVGAVLLMSKEQLIRRVLADPRLEIYSCGRTDIASGQVDRRVLATMEYLVEKGFHLTITSLKCGHSFLTASGNVSEHSSGNAMDIAAINGIPVLGHQGAGTLSDALIRSLLELQGTMTPHQIISLADYPGTASFPLADHADHVHVGFQPLYANTKLERQFVQLLKPDQWKRLINRLGEIDNPVVPIKPSQYSIQVRKGKRASSAHVGE